MGVGITKDDVKGVIAYSGAFIITTQVFALLNASPTVTDILSGAGPNVTTGITAVSAFVISFFIVAIASTAVNRILYLGGVNPVNPVWEQNSEEEEEWTYERGEEEVRRSFTSTVDKISGGEISEVIETEAGLMVILELPSTRQIEREYSITNTQTWDQRNALAVLFEYVGVESADDYLELADTDVRIPLQRAQSGDFTPDTTEMKNALGDDAFSVDDEQFVRTELVSSGTEKQSDDETQNKDATQ